MLFVFRKNPNLDSYRFTLEYEHIREFCGFFLLINKCCDLCLTDVHLIELIHAISEIHVYMVIIEA